MPDRKTDIETRAGPYLSLVVTARNDDHGGNLLGRMQTFVNGWISHARRHRIPSELVIVEWNPPADRPRLIDALRWPEDFGPCEVRFILVPPEVHHRHAHADVLPLYQMIGKNAGIRRARGRFVLATNIDILFSSELAAFLAKQQIQAGRMYRVDRHDVMSDVPTDAPVEEQLAYCRTHLLRINKREGTFNVMPDGSPALSPVDVAPAGSGILFGGGWFPVEHLGEQRVFRWAKQRAEVLLGKGTRSGSALVVDLEPGPAAASSPIQLEVVTDAGERLAQAVIDHRSQLRVPLPELLPERVWLRTNGGGAPAERDPRPLSIRVFRLAWERQREPADGAASIPLVLPSARRGTRAAALWQALQQTIVKLAEGSHAGSLKKPVSPRLRRLLKSYVEWGGFTGMARNALPHVRRRWAFKASAKPGQDVFADGSGLSPGAGWEALEIYRGESFRRAASGAELIVSPVGPTSREIGLQVEPSSKTLTPPLSLLLLDSAGRLMAQRRVDRLTFLRFALPPAAGQTQVFRLELTNADAGSQASAGSLREIKVFWCGWTRGGGRSASSAELPSPWGAGWRRDTPAGAVTASGRAELVVRVPELGERLLSIDLETSSPVAFEVRDEEGRVLDTFEVNGRQVHRLPLPAERGCTRVLQISASGPFRAYTCGWPPVSTAGSDAAAEDHSAPAFLHTNGCGDFTLMAREHWFDLRGYPEFDLFSMNLDSVLCFAAHHGGAREEVLTEPMRIYHIEHARGSGWTPEGQAKLFKSLAEKGLSFIDNQEVLRWASQMRRLNSPMIFNHEDWGLAGFELEEIVLPGPGRH